jgi:hypothetical protein
MRFIVPQFIDVEDKVIGPFSFKQFMYLAGGAGLAFSIYRFLPPVIAIPIALPVVGIALALTFYKVNGKPFVFVMQAFFNYIFQSKLYIWKRKPKKETVKKEEIQETESKQTKLPRLTESRLSDLSWSLDILDMKEGDE